MQTAVKNLRQTYGDRVLAKAESCDIFEAIRQVVQPFRNRIRLNNSRPGSIGQNRRRINGIVSGIRRNTPRCLVSPASFNLLEEITRVSVDEKVR